VTGRLNLIATIPHVGTDASQGVLQGQHGWQDLSLAVKFRVHTWRFERLGALSVFGVPVWGMPLTDYITLDRPYYFTNDRFFLTNSRYAAGGRLQH
jgi:hypothetical protein